MRRICCVLLVMVLVLQAVPAVGSAAQPQAGAESPSDWASAYIAQAREAGLVPQALEGKWSAPITREEFCTLAVRLLAIRNQDFTGWETVRFADTDSEAVKKAAVTGVVHGTRQDQSGTYFSPDRSISRQEAAVMLYQMTNTEAIPAAKRLQLTPRVWADRNQTAGYTSDGTERSYFYPWARDAVAFCYNADIMNGVSSDRFGPNETYTVEQSVVTMLKLKKWSEGNGQENKAAGKTVLTVDTVKDVYRYESLDGARQLSIEFPCGGEANPQTGENMYRWIDDMQMLGGHAVVKSWGTVKPAYAMENQVTETYFENYSLISEDGTQIARDNRWDGTFAMLSVLSDKLAWVGGDGADGLISLPDGKVLLESVQVEWTDEKHPEAWVFTDETTGLCGLFDENGSVTVSPQYEYLGRPAEGVLCAWRKGEDTPVLIDTQGRILSENCGIDWEAVKGMTAEVGLDKGAAFGKYVVTGSYNGGALYTFEGQEIIPFTGFSGTPVQIARMQDGTFMANKDGLRYLYNGQGVCMTPKGFDPNNYSEILFGRYVLCMNKTTADGGLWSDFTDPLVCGLFDAGGRKLSGDDMALGTGACGDGGNTLAFSSYIRPQKSSSGAGGDSGLAADEDMWAIVMDDRGTELCRIPDAPYVCFADGMVCVRHADRSLSYYTTTGHPLML